MSNIILDGFDICYRNYDSYTLKQNEVPLDKPIYIGFAVSELSKFTVLMYELDYA